MPDLCPTQVLVGHPFDTIKVRLQTDGADGQPKRFTGVVDAVKQTVRKEGPRGLCEPPLNPGSVHRSARLCTAPPA